MFADISKSALRRQIKQTLSALTSEEKSKTSRLLCQQIADYLNDHPEIQTVGTFAGLPLEPDLRALHELSRVILAYPLVNDDLMTFHAIAKYNDLTVGNYGIKEPTADHPFIDCPDLILCPGYAFTPEGKRLGKGGGFYDRFLAKKSTRTIGIVFPCQIVEDLPTEEHDRDVDLVLVSGL